LPRGQSAHPLLPAAAANVPGLQAVHMVPDVAPGVDRNLPAGQLLHTASCSSLYVPAPHFAQLRVMVAEVQGVVWGGDPQVWCQSRKGASA